MRQNAPNLLYQILRFKKLKQLTMRIKSIQNVIDCLRGKKKKIPSNYLDERYSKEYETFENLGGIITHRYPILSEYYDSDGTATGHYFHQDLLVSQFIHEASPERHIDIGSRIDGFVAHVASFRKIEILDIRDLEDSAHENISFLKADLTSSDFSYSNVSDSISCLHAIEHFGLGRYNDPIDPAGHLKGMTNIIKMLKPGGTLYLSFPIGKGNEIHFNAHRVFNPDDVFSWKPIIDGGLELKRFDYVDDHGDLYKNIQITDIDLPNYGCGIYTFEKVNKLS